MLFILCTLDTHFATAFDPKPFILTLEAAVDQLIAVRRDVQARTEQMEKSVKVTEREYSKKMADLNKGFEVIIIIDEIGSRTHFGDRQSANPSQAWKLK